MIQTRSFVRFVLLTLIAFWSPAGFAATSVEKAQKQEVKIPVGDVVLAATLYRPTGMKGDLPAIVTVHGSGETDRKAMADFTGLALDFGFAVLSFDKRGVGASTGKYERFNVKESSRIFQNLALDVVHSVRWLEGQPGIDRERIGLLGGSQAGWIMPLAASQEPKVRFIVTLSGVSVSAGQEAIHEQYVNAVWKSGQRLAWPQRYAANLLASEYTGPRGYDPAPVLEKIDTPTLWIWGLYDDNLPTIPSIDRIGELMKAGKTNNYVHILPYGGHGPRNVYTGELYDFRFIKEWLESIQILPPARER